MKTILRAHLMSNHAGLTEAFFYYRMVYPRKSGKLLVLGPAPLMFSVFFTYLVTRSEGSSRPLRFATGEAPGLADGPRNSAV